MPILSVQDLATYVPDLDLDSPQAAILKAQSLAEGPKGANRPLVKTRTTENPRASNDGIIRLSRWPIDITAEIKVEVRGDIGHTSLRLASFDFTEIAIDLDNVDVELCQITVPELAGYNTSRFSAIGSATYGYGHTGGHRRMRRTQGSFPFQVRVTYTAGFDFQADELSEEAVEIKSALAGVLELQNSSIAKGIKQYNFTDFVSATAGADLVQLAVSTPDSTLMGDYLSVFKKYCPKQYAF